VARPAASAARAAGAGAAAAASDRTPAHAADRGLGAVNVLCGRLARIGSSRASVATSTRALTVPFGSPRMKRCMVAFGVWITPGATTLLGE